MAEGGRAADGEGPTGLGANVAAPEKAPKPLPPDAAATAPKPVPEEAMAANEVDAPVPHEQLLPPPPPPQVQADGAAPEPQVHAGAGRFASGSSASGAARFAGSLINSLASSCVAARACLRGCAWLFYLFIASQRHVAIPRYSIITNE